MQRIRRAWIGKLTASLALAATVLHVAFLSLHLAMMASLALAGDANASQARLGFVICAPGRRFADDADPAGAGGADDGQSRTATFCPVCTGGAAPALILPEQPLLPAKAAALAQPPPVAVTPAIAKPRHETECKQSRGPPHAV
jgi:hypothetical protein